MAERLKNVLTKLIHPDQKGFVKGRNISEANRMIQDIIQYADEENEEGIIVFLDQQKAFDRVEWGWVDFVLKTFNFGGKFRGWIQMLVKNATTSIKTNGFVSKFFSISRSCRQGCPVAPLIYILQAEPMACAIRGNNDIKGIKSPGEPGGKELEAKISMFADDTQLFNKDERSVEKSFDILSKYEKASGSRINYNKTKAISIGNARHRKPKFNKISWIKENVKTLGVHHGYNVDNDKIWKDIIDRMKNCIQVWKSRKLSYKGKTIIVKNLLLSYCGFEIEMKGIPDKFKKEIETLLWDFIWEGKVNQIKRDVCCLDIENGGMSMVNLDSYIDSRRIKFIYRIINEPIENWNAIGKYWLSRFDFKFNETFFICKCSNVSSLNLNRYPLFYQKSIQAWTKFLQCVQKLETKTDILHVRLFGNCNITFQNKPLIFSSFLRSNIKTIQDIWDENSKQFIDCDLLYSQLIDRRNCISEYSKIKKCIPKDYLKFLKNENNDIENKTKSRNKMKLLNNLTLTDIRGKIINTKDVKIKIIQQILNKKSMPKCQDKWNNVYNEEFHWPKIWNNLKRLDISNKIKEFQWKCNHNIIYTESRLRKMNLSNGRCHLCKESNIQEDLQHLFFKCIISNRFISNITILINTLNVGTVNLNEKNMMFGFNMGGKHELLLNTLIFISKWSIWKARNKVKYDKIHINQNVLCNIWKQTLKSELKILLTANCNDTIDKAKILTILSVISK